MDNVFTDLFGAEAKKRRGLYRSRMKWGQERETDAGILHRMPVAEQYRMYVNIKQTAVPAPLSPDSCASPIQSGFGGIYDGSSTGSMSSPRFSLRSERKFSASSSRKHNSHYRMPARGSSMASSMRSMASSQREAKKALVSVFLGSNTVVDLDAPLTEVPRETPESEAELWALRLRRPSVMIRQVNGDTAQDEEAEQIERASKEEANAARLLHQYQERVAILNENEAEKRIHLTYLELVGLDRTVLPGWASLLISKCEYHDENIVRKGIECNEMLRFFDIIQSSASPDVVLVQEEYALRRSTLSFADDWYNRFHRVCRNGAIELQKGAAIRKLQAWWRSSSSHNVFRPERPPFARPLCLSQTNVINRVKLRNLLQIPIDRLHTEHHTEREWLISEEMECFVSLCCEALDVIEMAAREELQGALSKGVEQEMRELAINVVDLQCASPRHVVGYVVDEVLLPCASVLSFRVRVGALVSAAWCAIMELRVEEDESWVGLKTSRGYQRISHHSIITELNEKLSLGPSSTPHATQFGFHKRRDNFGV